MTIKASILYETKTKQQNLHGKYVKYIKNFIYPLPNLSIITDPGIEIFSTAELHFVSL